MARKIPANGTAKLNSSGTLVTIKNPARGTTQVLDAHTGNEVLSYSRFTGGAISRPSQGITRQVQGNLTTDTGPGGYRRVQDSSQRTDITSYHGYTISEAKANPTKTIIADSVEVRGRTISITGSRAYVLLHDPAKGGFFESYRPSWWGAPSFMDDHWLVNGGLHPYGLFFDFGAHIPKGYVSDWWNPSTNMFLSWANQPLQWARWDDYYSAWGWDWKADNFYPNYFVPMNTYRNFGYWIADYFLQRELETERLDRIAAEEYPDYVAEQTQELAINAKAVQQDDVSVPQDVFDALASQAQTTAAAIQTGDPVSATNLLDTDHIFTVSRTVTETAVIDGADYQCRLQPGDLIRRDHNYEVDVEPVLQSNGLPEVDKGGNVMNTTYVPMLVVSAKRQSCLSGATVIVQLDTLQDLASEERARTQEAIEQGVSLGIHP